MQTTSSASPTPLAARPLLVPTSKPQFIRQSRLDLVKNPYQEIHQKTKKINQNFQSTLQTTTSITDLLARGLRRAQKSQILEKIEK